MKTKDQIEFIKGLISAHFDKGYRLLQVKDTNEHNAKREKQKQTRQVRIVMGVLAFIDFVREIPEFILGRDSTFLLSKIFKIIFSSHKLMI